MITLSCGSKRGLWEFPFVTPVTKNQKVEHLRITVLPCCNAVLSTVLTSPCSGPRGLEQ